MSHSDCKSKTATPFDSRKDADFRSEQAISKLLPRHLERLAYAYLRQSSLQQIAHNQESTALQYKLVQRAHSLGWPENRVVVIDEDLGKSGQHAENRTGFQKLLAEISLDHVGIILVVEMSRLARSCKDWYHLLELCGIFGTLLADNDGVYDPSVYNDRLLLGLRGTMSEAELHVLRGRLWSGKLHKAQRGEMIFHVPTGYARIVGGKVTFDPDEQVRDTIKMIFDKFNEIGTAHGVLRFLVKNQIKLGFRPAVGELTGDLEWRRPNRSTLMTILHNPFYAGAYAFGRSRGDPRRKISGRKYGGTIRLAMKDWRVLIKDLLPAYITWDQFEKNRDRMAANSTSKGGQGAAREGRALLTGILMCKTCGLRLCVAYSKRGFFQYQCTRAYSMHGRAFCQTFSGQEIDALITQEVLRAIEPAALELSIATMKTMEEDRKKIDLNWNQRIERARYSASRAERQYRTVEPENRLVARTLERAWEDALVEVKGIEEEYDRFRSKSPARLTLDEIQRIKLLAKDIPTIWYSKTTSPKDRKEIVRLLIDCIYVNTRGKSDLADVEVKWKGGQISCHQISHKIRAYERKHDFSKIRARICDLRQEGLTSPEIAECLNNEGFRRAKGGLFKRCNVAELVQHCHLPPIQSQDHRLKPFLSSNEWLLSALAHELGMPYQTLILWRRKGWLQARRIGERQGRWVVWADSNERERLQKLYNQHPQNRWRLSHESSSNT